MIECQDKHFGRLLHAYELGMLSDTQRQELELHLLECPHCFERANRLEQAARLIRQDQDVQQTINEVAEEVGGRIAPTDGSGPDRKRSYRFLRTTLAAAAVLVFLLLKPWTFVIDQTAFASTDRVAVMYFEDVNDPEDLDRSGEVVASLLIADLTESQYVRVVSSQRLYDVLEILGHSGIKAVDRDIATQVAMKAQATWMLTGRIITDDSRMVISSELIEVATGDVLASQQVVGSADGDLFSMVDLLTVEVKNDLSLPAEAGLETDPILEEVLTDDPDAYRAYLDGLNFSAQFLGSEAKAAFEKAVELDSNFAMAYYQLSAYVGGEQKHQLLNRAASLTEHTTERERLLIRSRQAAYDGNTPLAVAVLLDCTERFPEAEEAHFRLGLYHYGLRLYDQAVKHLRRAVTIDPLHRQALNLLAYAYDHSGKLDSALTMIERYVELAPEEFNPYDSRGEILARNGRLQEAIKSYRKAVEINPDFTPSRFTLGHMLTLNGDYEEAAACYELLSNNPDPEVRKGARLCRVYAPVRQGKLKQAMAMLDEVRAIDSSEGVLGTWMAEPERFYANKSHLYAGMLRPDLARSELEKAIAIVPRAYQCFYTQYLAESGDPDSAARVSQTLLAEVDRDNADFSVYWYGVGATALTTGDFQLAVRHLENAARVSSELGPHYLLGRAYLAAGLAEKAIVEFDSLLSSYTEQLLYSGTRGVTLHYQLGLAYESAGTYDAAAEQFEIFLELWRDADPELDPLKNDARTRLNAIRAQS